MTVEKYGKHWAVYDGETLVCVTLYRKGAVEVKRRLDCYWLTPAGAEVAA